MGWLLVISSDIGIHDMSSNGVIKLTTISPFKGKIFLSSHEVAKKKKKK